MKENEKNAYMTVEASFLFPLIFGAILFTISLALYLYNATVLKQIASIVALRGSGQEVAEEELDGYLETQVDQLVKERLILVSKVEKKIQVRESKVLVRLKANVNLPFLEIPFLNFKWQELEFESRAERIHPVKIIRDMRRLYGSEISQ